MAIYGNYVAIIGFTFVYFDYSEMNSVARSLFQKSGARWFCARCATITIPFYTFEIAGSIGAILFGI